MLLYEKEVETICSLNLWWRKNQQLNSCFYTTVSVWIFSQNKNIVYCVYNVIEYEMLYNQMAAYSGPAVVHRLNMSCCCSYIIQFIYSFELINPHSHTVKNKLNCSIIHLSTLKIQYRACVCKLFRTQNCVHMLLSCIEYDDSCTMPPVCAEHIMLICPFHWSHFRYHIELHRLFSSIDIIYTLNTCIYFHVVGGSCCCFVVGFFRLQSSTILYCSNNIYYGYWTKSIHLQYEMGEGREKKSSCAWAFNKCVHILCFNDLFCGLNGSSFVPFENVIFFCLTSQFLLTIHTCSILFTKIFAVSTVIYFLLCFFLKKIAILFYSFD